MEGFPLSFRIHNEDCLRVSELENDRVFDLVFLEPPTGCDLANDLMPRLEALAGRVHELGFLLIHLDSVRSYEAKRAIDSLGLPFKGALVWAYRHRALKIKALQNQHDTILVYSFNPFYKAKREIFAHSVVGPSSGERAGYPGQKPVGLLKKIISFLNDYHRIETVLDPYMGSGTTLVAGLEMGKQVVGFDICPVSCQIAERRLLAAQPAARQLELELE